LLVVEELVEIGMATVSLAVGDRELGSLTVGTAPTHIVQDRDFHIDLLVDGLVPEHDS
jgi:hypothetical protein